MAIGDLAPLALAAGIVLWVSRPGSQKSPNRPDVPADETARIHHQAVEDMGAWGAGATFWQSSHRRLQNMGAETNKDLSLHPTNRDPTLASMYEEHAFVADYDSFKELLSLDTRQGEIRANKRNPIPSTLSEDLVHPADSSRVARFDTWHEMPNWANPTQIRQAEAIMRRDADPQNAMRRHYGVELFNRAPGQSFRYGTTN
jgi:hypothetical protein